MIRGLSFGLALLGQVTLAHAATLSSTVDRNQISQNETFTLTVTYDQQVDTSGLDIATLQNDFEVIAVRPQSSSSVSTVNGQTTQQESTIWAFTLAPKREGQLSIPAFKIKSDLSQPITIEVGAGSSVANSGKPLTVEVVVDKKTIFPSQQLLVTIEIRAQSDISDLNGPQLLIAGAEVEALGQQNYQRVDNGVATQVVSLKFAVFAQNAGELVVPRMTFSGVKGGRRSIFGNRGQQVVALSEQLKIRVQETPLSSNTWFPAEQVTIQSSWASELGTANIIKARVGDPITRTVTITAKSQRAAVIAPLPHSDSTTYKSYKDQAVLNNQITANGIVSTRIESEAVVPSIEGELILSELKLNWFNVNTSQWEIATLPEEVIDVLPAVAGPAALQNIQTEDGRPTKPSMDNAQSEQKTQENLQILRLWQLLCLVFVLATIWQFLYIRKLKKSVSTKTSSRVEDQNPTEFEAWADLQRAVKSKHAQSIKVAIYAWVKAEAPEQKTPSMKLLIEQIENMDHQHQVKTQIDALDAHLYDKGELNIDGLETALSLLKSSIGKVEKGNSQGLPPLYIKT